MRPESGAVGGNKGKRRRSLHARSPSIAEVTASPTTPADATFAVAKPPSATSIAARNRNNLTPDTVKYAVGNEWKAFYVSPHPDRHDEKTLHQAKNKAYVAKARALKNCLQPIIKLSSFKKQCATLLALLRCKDLEKHWCAIGLQPETLSFNQSFIDNIARVYKHSTTTKGNDVIKRAIESNYIFPPQILAKNAHKIAFFQLTPYCSTKHESLPEMGTEKVLLLYLLAKFLAAHVVINLPLLNSHEADCLVKIMVHWPNIFDTTFSQET